MVTESEIKIEQGPEPAQEERRLVVDAVGKLTLAAIGAVGLAQDAIEDLLERMVERGELSQSDARKLVSQLRAKRPRPFRRGGAPQSVAPDLEQTPTKAEIQTLRADIAALSAKLDEMKTAPTVSPKPVTAKVELPSAIPPKPPSS